MNKKEVLFLSILTLFTVLSWIIYDIYHTWTTNTLTVVQKTLMKPLTPTFDHDTILKIVDDNL